MRYLSRCAPRQPLFDAKNERQYIELSVCLQFAHIRKAGKIGHDTGQTRGRCVQAACVVASHWSTVCCVASETRERLVDALAIALDFECRKGRYHHSRVLIRLEKTGCVSLGVV